MNTKKDDADFALKLTLINAQEILKQAQDIRADRLTRQELKKIINKLKNL